MTRFRALLAVATVSLLVLAGCGSDDDEPTTAADDSTSTSTTEAAGAAEDATIQLAETSLGEVLVDAEGMTLYLFTKDSDGKSACSADCLDTWPPLIVTGDPTAGDGVDEDDLGTITRDDGSKQVTYDGKPLYFYAADTKAGDVNGHKVGGVWFAVNAEGEQAGSAPATGGGY